VVEFKISFLALWCVNSNIVTEIPINDTIYTCILKHNDTISG